MVSSDDSLKADYFPIARLFLVSDFFGNFFLYLSTGIWNQSWHLRWVLFLHMLLLFKTLKTDIILVEKNMLADGKREVQWGRNECSTRKLIEDYQIDSVQRSLCRWRNMTITRIIDHFVKQIRNNIELYSELMRKSLRVSNGGKKFISIFD